MRLPLAITTLAWVLPSIVCTIARAEAGTNVAAAPDGAEKPLPKVLLIGDSISIEYTDAVRQLLEKEADVRRIPGNGQSTDFGLENIDAWLGDERWDVIHFNWGIWDTHIIDGARIRNSPEVYRANLVTLVEKLKATGARLVWASTTPLAHDVAGALGVQKENTPIYNNVAASVMREANVPINDLYRRALPHLSALQTEDGVHFTDEGSAFLARYVVKSIRRELNALHPRTASKKSVSTTSRSHPGK